MFTFLKPCSSASTVNDELAVKREIERIHQIMEVADSSEQSPPSGQSSFPQNPEEFDADPRISFSKLDNKFILELDEEHEFEYDDALKRWVPVVRPHPPTVNRRGVLL